MAIVKQTPTVAARPAAAIVAPVQVSLPEERSEPSSELQDYSILLYGEKKIGKTSLAAHFPDTFFLMFEPGGKALRIYQKEVTRWAEFVAYIDLLEKEERFRTVVVDTVDLAYDACFDYVCKKLAINHPQDENDFGKSWGVIEREFTTQFNRLLKLGRGVIFISHATVQVLKGRGGGEFSRITPTAPKQAQRFLTATVDIWAYYGFHEGERWLTIRGNDMLAAGSRLTENFNTPEGNPIQAIPMGSSAETAYLNVQAAFRNEQLQAHADKAFQPPKTK